MAYHISEIKVTDFISDSTIKLPRFQRRQAWTEKQDFGLCVSMFKGYPLGVVIYNQTKNGARDINWLLDGRQRRTALKKLIENPKLLYLSAIKYLGIKPSAPEADLEETYWDKIGVYLNQGTNQSEGENDQEEEGQEEETDSDIDAATQQGNLKLLLELLRLLHGSQKKDRTAFEMRWDFGDYFSYLPYVDSKKKSVDPKKLKDFIVNIRERLGGTESITEDGFYEYFTVTEAFPLKENQGPAFRRKISEIFQKIRNDCDVMIRVQTNVFEQAVIGVIKINRVSNLDSQNIFSLVNKGGTPLKSQELLSAKPYWNTTIQESNLATVVRDSITELYRRLEIPGENDSHNGTFVYWDLCATFIDRIDRRHLLFPEYADEDQKKGKKKDDKLVEKIQLGFKAVAALLKDGVSTVRIEELEKDSTIDLVDSLDELQETINRSLALLLGNPFFQRLQSWHRPLRDLIGITPTLEYMAILGKLWKQLNCESGDNAKKFVRSAICLLDRLILEHARDEWRGSSDSKFSKHLKGDWEKRVDLLDESEWVAYLNKACASTSDDYKKHSAILYYFAVLQERDPDNLAELEYDIDHLIPQTDFDQLPGGLNIDKGLKNSLANVSLLPRRKNESKGDKKLNELSDDLRSLVAKYSDLKLEDFEEYSHIDNVSKLVEERKKVFMEVLKKRQQIVLG